MGGRREHRNLHSREKLENKELETLTTVAIYVQECSSTTLSISVSTHIFIYLILFHVGVNYGDRNTERRETQNTN